MLNQTLDLIAARRSHRAYEETKVTKEQLDALLKAALESPSARNCQPWHFTAVTDKRVNDLVDQRTHEAFALVPAEKRSARFLDPAFHVFYRAPLVIYISCDPDNHFSQIDCGIATENIVLAAQSMGLGSVIIGLIREAFLADKDGELQKALKFPEGYKFAIAIAIGVPTDSKAAHEPGAGKVTLL